MKKCIGVREDTGEKCQRSASRDSDFCFMHQSQEDNQKIQHLDDDVYYCPNDGKKLHYEVKWDYHRCKKCHGSLYSGKTISSDIGMKISQSAQIEQDRECCSCLEGDNLSIHGIEYKYVAGNVPFVFTRYRLAMVCLCNNCGSVWLDCPEGLVAGMLEWLCTDGVLVKSGGRAPLMGEVVRSSASDGHLNWFERQEHWRAKRLEQKVEKERKKAEKRLKLCNHVDDSGEKCNISKSQKSNHDSDFCWKHQPE